MKGVEGEGEGEVEGEVEVEVKVEVKVKVEGGSSYYCSLLNLNLNLTHLFLLLQFFQKTTHTSRLCLTLTSTLTSYFFRCNFFKRLPILPGSA